MKRFLFMGAAAFLMSTAVNAQIVKSSSNQTIITTKTQVTQVKEKKGYNRIYLGYASTKVKTTWDGGSEKGDANHGFNLGWTIGRNVTQNKLPLYIETGLDFVAGPCDYYYDFESYHHNYYYSSEGGGGSLVDIEVPVNVTYRYKIGRSKVLLAPYFGFHLKFNGIFDDIPNKVCRFGLQLGANFDIKHFYVGVGWDKDVTSVADDDDIKALTGGARLRIGVTW